MEDLLSMEIEDVLKLNVIALNKEEKRIYYICHVISITKDIESCKSKIQKEKLILKRKWVIYKASI